MCFDKNGNWVDCTQKPALVKPKKKSTVATLKDGITAQYKMRTGQVSLADDALIHHRRAVCSACHYQKNLLGVWICGFCQCPILQKTQYNEFQCDLGKWS